MRILFAVKSCHRDRHRAAVIRETWGRDLHGADLRFFYGRPILKDAQPDEVSLDVPDDYWNLAIKIQAICQYAIQHGYDYVLQIDADTYVQPERALASGFEQYDYTGMHRAIGYLIPIPYIRGFACWFSARAVKCLAEAELPKLPKEWCSDSWVGKVMKANGIEPQPDTRYHATLQPHPGVVEGPRDGNDIIACCEFTPVQMRAIDLEWRTMKAGEKQPRETANLPPTLKPFYHHGDIVIYHGHTPDVVTQFSKQYFQTLFLDPPFTVRDPHSLAFIKDYGLERIHSGKIIILTNPKPGFIFKDGVNTNWRHSYPNLVADENMERPLEEVRWLLQLTDGMILDPFMGNGNTLVAAQQLGRPAVGIDISLSRCEKAVEKLRKS